MQEEWEYVAELREELNFNQALVGIFYAQAERAESEEEEDEVRKRIAKFETQNAKLNENLIKEENLVRKKDSAYSRKVQTEDMRRHIKDVKDYKKHME